MDVFDLARLPIWAAVTSPRLFADFPNRHQVGIGMLMGLCRNLGAEIRHDHVAPIRRARPCICRLTSFSFVFCPSVWPFDHGSMSAAFTGAWSRAMPEANEAARTCFAFLPMMATRHPGFDVMIILKTSTISQRRAYRIIRPGRRGCGRGGSDNRCGVPGLAVTLLLRRAGKSPRSGHYRRDARDTPRRPGEKRSP